MEKAKTSDEIDGIISDLLDTVSSGKAKEEDYKKAEIVARLIGKQLKKDSLRLSYCAMQKKAPPVIAAFEGVGTKNPAPQKK
ncbi:MAG: hypothetical protein LBJ90_06495 [Treponema sp.]|jgi:hypothetical protein|nr:hypothetical protein [Treponema sp.]